GCLRTRWQQPRDDRRCIKENQQRREANPVRMRIIVVGLGTQGRKRVRAAAGDVVATVDPVNPDANYTSVEQVSLDAFDAALICTPDPAKIALMEYFLSHGKHVLVEKPLLSAKEGDLARLAELARSTGAACYTAYNHRFEPH